MGEFCVFPRAGSRPLLQVTSVGGKSSNATNQGGTGATFWGGWALSELPWPTQAPFSNPREYELPASTEQSFSCDHHSRQQPAEDRAEPSTGIPTVGRRGGGTRGTKSPAAQKCLPRETERKQTPTRFQQPYNANVFKPRRALLALSRHLMRISCLPCCCHYFYLGLLITHKQPLRAWGPPPC